MILELIAMGLIISACMSIYLDEAVYSTASLACVFFLTAILYALNNAIFASLFQLAIGTGTLVVLFLAGEMLSEKSHGSESLNKVLIPVFAGLLISLPVIFLSVPSAFESKISNVPFAYALWNLRAIDVVLQALVMVSVAIGIMIILYEKGEGER